MQAAVMPNGGPPSSSLGTINVNDQPRNPSPANSSYNANTNMPPRPPASYSYPQGYQQFPPQPPQGGPYYPGGQQNGWYPGRADPSYYAGANGAYNGYYPPASGYPSVPYPNYMPPHQMGGPGPATLQNAYTVYQGENYTPRQQHPAHPGDHHAPPQPFPPANGHESIDHSHFGAPPPPGEGHYNNPQQPPPQFAPTQEGQYAPTYSQHGPGHHPPPFVPPNHPYNYGGGFGYQHAPPPNYPYGPGFQPQSVPPSSAHPSHRPLGGKGLNPAAQGFTFRPSQTPRPSHVPQDVPNGGGAPIPPKLEPEEPTFPSLSPAPRPPRPEQPSQVPSTQTNGVLDESPNHANGDVQNKDGGLGLSQMDPALSTPKQDSVPMTQETGTSKSSSGNTPAMTSSETSDTPATVETPRANTDRALSSSPPIKASIVNADDLTFTGPTVSGYVSPPTDVPSLPSMHGKSSAPVPNDSAKGPAPSRASLVIKTARRRPRHDAFTENSYLPSLVKDAAQHHVQETPEDSLTEKPEGGSARRGPRKGRVLISMGNGDDTAMRIHDAALVFGELTASEIPAIVIRSTPKAAPTTLSETTEAATATAAQESVTPPVPQPAAPSAPKPKPSSWAALLGGGKGQAKSIETASLAPSSLVVSPSKSSVSLLTETDAQTSDPVTPRSAAPSLPPPSTGVSTANGPRPAFNYAAAAAAGKNLSPENELTKLLTDGLKARPKAPLQASVPRGLINTGNMCFANTILQMLVYCPPFADLFEELGRRLRADLSKRTPLVEALIIFLREFQPTAESGTSTPVSDSSKRNGTAAKGKAKEKKYTVNDPFIPENVYDAMKENKRFDSMRRGHQEDAEEFLGFFINTLHEELLHLVSRTESTRSPSSGRPEANGDAVEIRRPVSPVDGWLEVGKKQKTNVVRNTETRESAVSRIFGGTLRSVLHTPGQKDSVTLEPYQPLQLDIQSPTVRSIADALKHLNEPEVVPGVWSAARNCNVDATKQVYIETFPPVLILHLKRFVYDPLARDVVKKNKPVAYSAELVIPPEIISPARRSASAVKYRLFAVDYHHGSSASGGHYTIAVSRQDAKGWIHFDDETHSTLAEEDVVVSQDEAESGKFGLVGGREKCAYLLFYQRVR